MARKALTITPALRRKVETLAADMAERQIALVLGISRGTLRKHFAVELETGRLRVHAETLLALRRAVRKGSAAAIRISLHRLDMAEAADKAQADPAPPKLRKLGKKEQAQLDAETADDDPDSGWGDLLRPPVAARVN